MKLSRFWLIFAACIIAVVIACYPSARPSKVRAGGVIYSPVPACTGAGQASPCQPTWNPNATPTPVPTNIPAITQPYSACLSAGCSLYGPRVAVGPQATITCAPSSVSVTTSSGSIQTIVNGNPAGTSYCFSPGTYTQPSWTPKNGDTYIGQYGAIFDGQNTATFAVADNGGPVTNVTVKNFTIKNYASASFSGAVGATRAGNVSSGWTIQNDEIYNSGAFAFYNASSNTSVIANSIHDNGQGGAALTGNDGTSAQNDVVTDNIFYNNNNNQTTYPFNSNGAGAIKIYETWGNTVSYNYSYNNNGPGLWSDTDNQYVTFTHNDVENNGAAGIQQEISYNGVIQSNYVSGNGNTTYCGSGPLGSFNCGGIFVSNSGGQTGTTLDISNNIIIGSQYGGGVTWLNANRGSGIFGTWQVQNVKVHNNNVNLTASGSIWGAIDNSGTNPGMFTSQGNSFDYDGFTGSTTANVFAWGEQTGCPCYGNYGTFATFQADGQETHATFTALAPGPLTLGANDAPFANPSATPTTVAISDPNYTSGFTVSTAPNAVVSASITGNGPTATLNLSVVAPGSATVTVKDTTNSVTMTSEVGTPGPMALATSQVVFPSATATPTTVPVTDPGGKPSSLTVSPTPAGIVSASISGSNVVLTPQSVGTATAYVSDGYNTLPLSVYINPATPTPTPTPIYTNPAPNSTSTPTGPLTWPIGPIASVPTPGVYTVLAQIKCAPTSAQVSNGSVVLTLGSEISLKAGACQGSTNSNPATSAGAQAYSFSDNVLSYPLTQLNASPTQYILVATDTGGSSGSLTYWVCSYPGTISCVAATPATVTGNATYSNANLWIGSEADGSTRVFAGDIWNVEVYSQVIATTASGMATAVTAVATSDPYPSPTPVATPIFSDPYPNNTATPSGQSVWPVATSAPTPLAFTWIAQINCNTPVAPQLTAGSTIMALGSTGNYTTMKAGICNAATPQTVNSTAAQVYSTTGVSSTPTNGLSSGTNYIIAVTDAGSSGNLVYYVCPVTSSIVCTAAPAGTITSAQTFASNALEIGAEVGGTVRVFAGDIWNILIYNSVVASNATQMAAWVTAIQTPDPYPTPATTTAWPNSGFNPFPNGGPLQTKITTLFGTDAGHIAGTTGNCPFTSSGYGSIQSTTTTSQGYTTCYHIYSSNVTSQIQSDMGGATAQYAIAQSDVGSQSYLAGLWSGGSHTCNTVSNPNCSPYGSNANSANDTAAIYISTSGMSTMGVSSSGCSGYTDTVNDAGISYPMASNATNAVHYLDTWIPQIGPDSHLVIRDTVTGLDWISIESGIPNDVNGSYGSGANVLATNGGYWPSTYAPFEQSNGTLNPPPGPNCKSSTGNGTYSSPGTVANMYYTTAKGGQYSHGIAQTGTAGRMSLFYAFRPDEVVGCANANGNPSCVTHALTFNNYCDTYNSSNSAYVNFPAYGYGDGYSTTNTCADNGGNPNNYVDYGGLLWSDSPPAAGGTSTCNWFEWFYWETAYLYGLYKNDNTGENFGGYKSYAMFLNDVPDSSDTYNVTNQTQWQAASAWYQMGVLIGQTPTYNSAKYQPKFKNGDCGLTMATNMHYLVPPVNTSSISGLGYPTWGFTHR